MLRKTQTDRETDRIESVSPSDQSKPDWLKDSTEGEILVWKRATPDNKMVKSIENLINIFGHSVTNHGKRVQKQLKKMKRNF